MYLHKKKKKKSKYNALIVFILYCKTLAAIEVNISKVRDRFGSMSRFKGGLRCKGPPCKL